MDDIKVFRIYEFSGPKAKVDRQLKLSLPDGTTTFGHEVLIKVTTLGTPDHFIGVKDDERKDQTDG